MRRIESTLSEKTLEEKESLIIERDNLLRRVEELRKNAIDSNEHIGTNGVRDDF